MPGRACAARKDDGQPCRQAALHDSEFCFWHCPEQAEQAAQARRMGGQRRRRESAIAAAFDFEGLKTVAQVQRLLELAVIDTLALDNSLHRSRALAYLARVALRAIQEGETEERLRALEAAVFERLRRAS